MQLKWRISNSQNLILTYRKQQKTTIVANHKWSPTSSWISNGLSYHLMTGNHWFFNFEKNIFDAKKKTTQVNYLH